MRPRRSVAQSAGASPTAEVTVTDINPTFVADIAAGDLGSHPHATVRFMDATTIDALDGYYDLAVFALSLHHLPPELAAQVRGEGSRAANKLLINRRPQAIAGAAFGDVPGALPFARVPVVHDAIISGLRAYSPSALRALAHHADPAINVEFRTDERARPCCLQLADSDSCTDSAAVCR